MERVHERQQNPSAMKTPLLNSPRSLLNIGKEKYGAGELELERDNWIVRQRGQNEVHALRREKTPIASEQSAYQLVEIVRTTSYGEALVLDGVYQSSAFDQLLKHEALVHPVMGLRRNERIHVLVVGGGEGCVVREVLRHKNTASVTMLELDPLVAQLCERHLGWDQGALHNSKVSLYFGDASKSLPSLPPEIRFDIAIVDSTAPTEGSVAGPLVETEFLKAIKSRLQPNGFVAGYGINAAPLASKLRSEIRQRSKEVFSGELLEYVVPCPFYSASFAFQICSLLPQNDLKKSILENFERLNLEGDKALDSASLESYFSIPWGYR